MITATNDTDLTQFHEARQATLTWRKRLCLTLSVIFMCLGAILVVNTLTLLGHGREGLWPAYNGGLTLIVIGVIAFQFFGAYDAHSTSAEVQQKCDLEIAELREMLVAINHRLDGIRETEAKQARVISQFAELRLNRRDPEDSGPWNLPRLKN